MAFPFFSRKPHARLTKYRSLAKYLVCCNRHVSQGGGRGRRVFVTFFRFVIPGTLARPEEEVGFLLFFVLFPGGHQNFLRWENSCYVVYIKYASFHLCVHIIVFVIVSTHTRAHVHVYVCVYKCVYMYTVHTHACINTYKLKGNSPSKK